MYLRKLSKRRTFESYLFHLVSVPSLKMGGGTHFWLVWSVPSKAKKSVPSNGINRVDAHGFNTERARLGRGTSLLTA